MTNLAEFHVGDLVTSMTKASLVPGGQEALLYTTVLGGIGALLPFVSREDLDFFTHLEMHLRQENPPLCGRDHLAFRSAYTPVKVPPHRSRSCVGGGHPRLTCVCPRPSVRA